jgi:hypothetical protein
MKKAAATAMAAKVRYRFAVALVGFMGIGVG